MKLSRKVKNSYWMPYTDNKWFKKKPKLLKSAKGMYYQTETGEKILDAVAGLWCVNAGHCRKKIVKAVTPMKNFGSPDDIAWAAVYLASDESKFVTGQTISPNGGFVMSQ